MRATTPPLVAALVVALPAAAVWWARRSLVVITVRGLSMVPAFDEGDRVLIRRVPPARVRAGDVVVVEQPPPEWSDRRNGTELVIKRVAGRADGGLVVLGDNPAESYDSRHYGPVPPEGLVGVVVRRLRAARPPEPVVGGVTGGTG